MIVDLEGTASRLVSRAIAEHRSCLFLCKEALLTLDRQVGLSDLFGKKRNLSAENSIPARVYAHQRGNSEPIDKKIIASLAAASIPALATHLHERSAYKAMFVDKLTLDELDRLRSMVLRRHAKTP